MGEIINLNKNIIESAKISACKINDKKARIRAFALNVAANATAQYLDNKGLQSDTSISLYKIPSFEQDFEVADVYVKGFRLDVRISFDGQTFTIPKLHEKYSVQPLAYIVVKLDKKIEKIEFLGFVPTEGLQMPSSDNEYYTLSVNILNSMSVLKELIESSTLNIHPYSANCHEKIKELCVPFMDGEISESEKVFFIKHVLACPVCRETFCDINDFDTITAQIRNYQELLNDSTLSVLSGNKKEVDEAKFENLALVENAQENTEASIEEIEEENSPEEFFASEEQEESIELSANGDESAKQDVALETDTVPTIVPVSPLVDLPDPDMLSSVNLEISQDNNTTNIEELEDVVFSDSNEKKQNEESVDIWEENQGYGYPLTEDNNEKLKNEQEEPELLLAEDTDAKFDSHAEIQEENEESLALLEENPIEPQEQSKSTGNLTETLTDIEPLEPLSEIDSVNETKVEENMEIEHIEEHEELQELHEEELISEPYELIMEDSESLDINELAELEPLHEDESHIETTIKEEAKVEQESLFELNLEDNNEHLQEVDNENEDQHVVESSKNPYVQEPFELNYDEESDNKEPAMTDEQTNEEESSVDYEQITDEGDTSVVSDDYVTDNVVENVERPVTQEQPVSTENAELQNLLDADLMALLSDDDSTDEVQKTTAEIDELAQESAQLIEEHQNKEPKQEDIQANENIESLFENNEKTDKNGEKSQEFELAKEPLSEETMKKTKRIAVLTGLLVVLMAAGGGMFFVNHQKASNNNDMAANDTFFDSANSTSQNKEENQGVSQDINRSMTNSFSDKPAAITITKLSWQISEKLALDPSVKEYLQTAGKNIQMNLQNDLANSADVVFNNIVKVSLTIAPDNSMKGLQILESSGSDKIDEEISKSIKNTLKYISVPKIKNHNSDYFLTLIINF